MRGKNKEFASSAVKFVSKLSINEGGEQKIASSEQKYVGYFLKWEGSH